MTDNVLSVDDVWALRNADGVSFRTAQGESHIRAWITDSAGTRLLTIREQTVFGGVREHPRDDRYRDIPVGSYRVQDWTGATGDQFSGYASHMFRTAEWSTTAGSIRAGDVLAFEWTRGNDHRHLTEAGLTRDELRMSAGKPGDRTARHWLIAVSVGLDNSGRMTHRSV